MNDHDIIRYATTTYPAEFLAFCDGCGPGPTATVCDCSVRGLDEKVDAVRPRDRELFVALLALECTLVAGVHEYDPGGYERYRERVGRTLLVITHGGFHLGVRRPHLPLALFADPGRAPDLVRATGRATLPRWAEAYDAAVRPGGGGRVLAGLASDRDVAWNPWGLVDPAVLEAFRGALGEAADAAGEA